MLSRPNLASIPSLPFSGLVYRAVPEASRNKILSTEGNRYYPGRYHVAGETGILYTSVKLDVAIREMERHDYRANQGELVASKIKVKLQKVLDLTQTAILAKLAAILAKPGLSKDDLISPDFSITHAISLRAREAGLQGLLVPSATKSGVNLIIFENNLAEGCLIEVEEINSM
ncbi:MAG: RES family NAD+ phosphorylase [Elusimicrobia bacterium]|nr:RES family NAD+ phosphorylase [Elusimicrobiota bacterium]